MRRVAIGEFLEAQRNAVLLDVRSPSEFHHAHIPGALSLPLFTDEERKVVGTTYKQQSREDAIKVGLDYFGPKMRRMVEEVNELIVARSALNAENSNSGQRTTAKIFLYCWRGGMRSGAVGWLLSVYGFDVTVLAGGYKAFRNYVLQTFGQPFSLKILGGYTGSGKSKILRQLKIAGEKVIDLENIASHKGSAFGNIGMPKQPSQEMFENVLSCELRALMREQSEGLTETATPGFKPRVPHSIWVEDESQRIGLINIPHAFWQQMRCAPVFFLDIPFEERLRNIVAEYGSLDKERMLSAIQRIAKRLGPLETKNAMLFLQEGKIEESFRLLLQYYDKHYLKGLHNRENLPGLLTKITCETVTEKNAALLSQPQLVS